MLGAFELDFAGIRFSGIRPRGAGKPSDWADDERAAELETFAAALPREATAGVEAWLLQLIGTQSSMLVPVELRDKAGKRP